MSLGKELHFKSNRIIDSRLTILLLISTITFIKTYYLWMEPLNLFFDEAQYWIWSKQLDWGYYSKPPMVAWLIALTTSVCGDGESCIRLSSPLVHMVTGLVVYEIGRELYGSRIGFYSGLTYSTLPAVFVSSFLVSTDPSLLMFWALALLGFTKAIRTNQWRWWVLAGLAGGAGMLSKYTMIIFAVSSAGYLLSAPPYRHHLWNKRYWLAATLALLLFIPNIIWNMQHGFVSFLHTKDNANLAGALFHPMKLLEFMGGQFGVFGPILFVVFLCVIFRPAIVRDKNYALPYWFVAPLFGLIMGVALLSRAHANWAAPAYVAATLLVVAYMINTGRKRLAQVSIVLHLFLAAVVLCLPLVVSLLGITFSNVKSDIKNKVIYDPLIQVKGWKTLGDEVALIRAQYPGVRLLVDTRKLYAELVYYVEPHPFDTVKWNPYVGIRDHFDLTAGLQNVKVGEDFIVVLDDIAVASIENHFNSVRPIKTILIPVQHPENNQYEVYYAQGFKGVGSLLP
jgi:4-amino-4-deoxy-L-arabinose transferase-like glycosyltransferase